MSLLRPSRLYSGLRQMAMARQKHSTARRQPCREGREALHHVLDAMWRDGADQGPGRRRVGQYVPLLSVQRRRRQNAKAAFRRHGMIKCQGEDGPGVRPRHREVGDGVAGQPAVRDHDDIAIAVQDARRAPTDFQHAPLDRRVARPMQLDVIADADRPVQIHRQSGEGVQDQLADRHAEHQPENAGRRQQHREILLEDDTGDGREGDGIDDRGGELDKKLRHGVAESRRRDAFQHDVAQEAVHQHRQRQDGGHAEQEAKNQARGPERLQADRLRCVAADIKQAAECCADQQRPGQFAEFVPGRQECRHRISPPFLLPPQVSFSRPTMSWLRLIMSARVSMVSLMCSAASALPWPAD